MGASFTCFLLSQGKSVLAQGSYVSFSWGLRGLGLGSLPLRASVAHIPGGA